MAVFAGIRSNPYNNTDSVDATDSVRRSFPWDLPGAMRYEHCKHGGESVTDHMTRRNEFRGHGEVLDALELLRDVDPVPDGVEQRILETALQRRRHTGLLGRATRASWLMWPVGVAASLMAVALGTLSGLEAADSLRSSARIQPPSSGSSSEMVIALDDPFSAIPLAQDWLEDLALVIPEGRP